jgi:PAS domain S-box-containing protein
VAFVDRRFAAQEQALAESKQHFRMVVANAPVILFALDAAGVVTLARRRGLAALGHTPDGVIGHSFFELYYDVPELMQQGHRALARHLRCCREWEYHASKDAFRAGWKSLPAVWRKPSPRAAQRCVSADPVRCRGRRL